MQKIPMPEVLDPDRTPGDAREEVTVAFHRARAQSLEAALRESCEYGQQLWRDLDAARAYLLASLPPVILDGQGSRPVAGAAPRGPDDSGGWSAWADAYAAITSVLAGPHGDSGFGRQEAVREARDRGATV